MGNGKFLTPNISPNFDRRSLKIFLPLELLGSNFSFEFQDPITNTGAWGDDKPPTHIF